MFVGALCPRWHIWTLIADTFLTADLSRLDVPSHFLYREFPLLSRTVELHSKFSLAGFSWRAFGYTFFWLPAHRQKFLSWEVGGKLNSVYGCSLEALQGAVCHLLLHFVYVFLIFFLLHFVWLSLIVFWETVDLLRSVLSFQYFFCKETFKFSWVFMLKNKQTHTN